MSEDTQIQDCIKDFILASLPLGEDAADFDEKTELLTSGLLDSLATLRLITYIEEQFDMEIEPEEADETYLDTIEAIVSLVQSKR